MSPDARRIAPHPGVPFQQVDLWLTRVERCLTPDVHISDRDRLATLKAVLYNIRYELGRVP